MAKTMKRPSLRSKSSEEAQKSEAVALAVESQEAEQEAQEEESRFADNPYARCNVTEGYTRVRKGRGRRKVLTGFLVFLLVAIIGLGGGAFAYFMKIQSNMHQGIDDELMGVLDQTYGGDPFYILLLGVDGSYDRGAAQMNDNTGTRSDSMILARVDPENKQVTMVSLHRDTMMQLGSYGTQKLNAAHALGGPAYAVQVVEEFAGVDISHYAEINFDAFSAMVDELGGVTVDVPIDINDWRAGGYIPAGEQTLNGEQALLLCRARHAYDAYGDGDRYRAANQRMVLGAIMEKVLSSDPITMANTLEALSQYVVTDLSVTDVLTIATQMVGMDLDSDFYTAMEPTTSEYVNNTWYEHVIQSEWDAMMARVDQGLPPTEEDVVDASGTVLASTGKAGASSSESEDDGSATKATPQRSGVVSVKNGTAIAGVGAEAVDLITPLGYTATAGNANRTDYPTTVVVYDNPSQKEAAEEIVEALGCGQAIQNQDTYLYEGDFLVLIGADWS